MATVSRNRAQFQGLFNDMWTVIETVNFASAADAGFAASDITVPGVAVGDIVLGVSIGVDVTDVGVSAQVTAANTVTVVLDNNTGGAVDLASTTVKLVVVRPNF